MKQNKVEVPAVLRVALEQIAKQDGVTMDELAEEILKAMAKNCKKYGFTAKKVDISPIRC